MEMLFLLGEIAFLFRAVSELLFRLGEVAFLELRASLLNPFRKCGV